MTLSASITFTVNYFCATKSVKDFSTPTVNLQQQQPEHSNTAHSTESELVANNEAEETKTEEAISSVLTTQIDRAQSRIKRGRTSEPTEPEYLDETHSWSEKLPESDDYWHFVGRYE